MISRQEAAVLLGQLELCHCTETIETVSISNSVQLRKADSDNTSTTMVDRYKKRPPNREQESLYEFFHRTKNRNGSSDRGCMIPHFVGVNGTPKFPVTADYAKHQLIVHKPWRTFPKSGDWISDFHQFINHPSCPTSAKMTYQRVHVRYLTKTQGYDPTSDFFDHSKNPIGIDDIDLMDLIGFHKTEGDEFDDSIIQNLHTGSTFNWDRKPKVSWTSLSAKFNQLHFHHLTFSVPFQQNTDKKSY